MMSRLKFDLVKAMEQPIRDIKDPEVLKECQKKIIKSLLAQKEEADKIRASQNLKIPPASKIIR